jgi:hypothetical protein
MTEGLQHVARLHRTKFGLVLSTLLQHNAKSHLPHCLLHFPIYQSLILLLCSALLNTLR